MREAAFLHYDPLSSFWHRHDGRLKLLETAYWSVMALAGSTAALGASALVIVGIHAASGTRIRRMRKALLFWLTMAAAIILASGIGDRANRLVLAGWTLPVGSEGLIAGTLRSARLLTVLLAGQLLAATTDPADLAGALRRLTAFLPRSWSAILATAVSLTLAFLPRLLDEGMTVRDAAFSRGLGERRSVIRRSAALGLPLAEATLRGADVMGDALLSRGIIDNPTPPEMRITGRDIAAFLLAVLPAAAGEAMVRIL